MLKFAIGIISGSILTVLIIGAFINSTWIVTSCDVAKYGGMWTTLDKTLVQLLNPSTGLHCRRGMIVVRAPGPGRVYKETNESLENDQ